MHRTALILAALAFVSLPHLLYSQATGPGSLPNVYLDCQRCDFNYIRTHIAFVNYVRDQDDANIYLRITNARTGSGSEYILDFRGIPPFTTRRDTLTYFSFESDTWDEERMGLARHIRIGLIPFMTQTAAIRHLNVYYDPPSVPDEPESETESEDPWNYWVFDVNVSSGLRGEQSEKALSLNTGLYAERITESWKISLRARNYVDRRTIELRNRTITANRDWGEYWGLFAYSISNHASIGLFSQVNYSRRTNLKLNASFSPSFEYNLFPYREYQERRFLLGYHITPSYRDYFQTTIFLRDSEWVVEQQLSARLRYDQPWGRIDIEISGSNYFHDTSINRFEFNPSINYRIIRGLSVSISGQYRTINDQIALPAGDITDEEALIGARQRATSYDYRINFGLSYTFGSIYSNIVNPRF
ncbi:MAG: hypothetical protein WDZ29_07910 [Balneolaceae bacterium]